MKDEGRVDLDGTPLKGISRDARPKRIAVLFQGAGAGWPMQVRDLVALGRRPHRRAFGGLDGADQAAIDRAMARTDVARFRDRIVVLGEGRVAADGHPDLALTDRLLSDVFGVTVCRGAGPDGTPYILPWNRSGPLTEEIDATFPKQP